MMGGPQAGLQAVCTRVLARVHGVPARRLAYSHRVLVHKGPCLQAERISFASHYNYLWRAVDQDGNVLDILVQSRRNKRAAKRFVRKLLKGCQYVPRVIITDKLASYGAAKRESLPSVEHRQHRYLNNRAENSHQPTRQWERRMQQFKSPGQAQRFLSAYGPIAQHIRLRRHLLPAPEYRQDLGKRFHTWQEITRLSTVA
jgi:putative transposase